MDTRSLLKTQFNIDDRVIDLVERAEEAVSSRFSELDGIRTFNQYKILKAFQDNRVSDSHFAWNTGYGYDDRGREITEKVFADVFGAEKALVRTQIVSGTHALSLALSGVLRPGDELIYASGAPYDTLEEVIGTRGEGMGSLKEFGITYKQVELRPDGSIDLEALGKAITEKTRMVSVQRSSGYSWRAAITIDEIARWADFVHSVNKDIVCMVDNCYGEFMDTKEPTEVGVDIMAGSLIKNPGGGIALSGGYVAGRADLIDKVAYRLTCPGIGGEVGLTFGQTRTMLQGLFLAPSACTSAVKGAVLCAQTYKMLNFEISPDTNALRSDIIQCIKLGSKEKVVAFCQGVQAAAPVESFVMPEPSDMPGYEDPVVMAAGAFVQGSSIELSADAPIREPYIVYFQGGLTYDHSKFGVIMSLQKLLEAGLLDGIL